MLMNTRTSLKQNFNAIACFIPELLIFCRLLLDVFLYFYVLLQTLIKSEQTPGKTPNFQKMLMNTRTSLRQNVNAVACFVSELLIFHKLLLNLFLYFYALLQTLIKSEQTVGETPTFKKCLYEHLDKPQAKFQCCCLFCSQVINFLQAACGSLFIFLWTFMDFNKIGTNTWKCTKLSGNAYEHWDKPYTKFQCRSLLGSPVNNFWMTASGPKSIFLRLS